MAIWAFYVLDLEFNANFTFDPTSVNQSTLWYTFIHFLNSVFFYLSHCIESVIVNFMFDQDMNQQEW